MSNLDWLKSVETVLPQIEVVAMKCDETLRKSCFEMLLSHYLDSIKFPSQKKKSLEDDTGGKEEADSFLGVFSKPFEIFLQKNSLKIEEIETNLENLRTGEIYIRDLGTKMRSEQQRRIAVLIGLKNLAASGDSKIPDKDLIKTCQDFVIYDSKNFVANMENGRYNNSTIFSKDGDSWKFTPNGNAYMAIIVNKLLGKTVKK